MPSATRPHRPARSAPRPTTRLDREPLHLGAQRVPRDAGGAGIDDVADARHRERGLRHVGGEHDPLPGVGREHPVLLGRRQPRIQRQHVDVTDLLAAHRVSQTVGRVPDLPLAGQEDQDVAAALALQLGDAVDDRADLVAVGVGRRRTGRGVGVVHRPVPHLHRVGATGDLDHRRAAEVLAEPGRVDRGGRDDDLEVGTSRQQLVQVAEDEVDVERPLCASSTMMVS